MDKKKWLKLVLLFVLFIIIAAGVASAIPDDKRNQEAVTEATTQEVQEISTDISTDAATEEVREEPSEPLAAFDLTDIPVYSGEPYVEVNNNVPYFTDLELVDESYEIYSELDELGRAGVCMACLGQDLMPDEERGSSSIEKPTGWQSVEYEGVVDGNYLYNACHLIGYQLTGENNNINDLVTGTRYMNVEGMLPFENQIAEYIRETDNHVLYRVTPVFQGDNLLVNGVLMEAKSVEDNGGGVLFNVFCYNVQPGVVIDYADGSSYLDRAASESTGEAAPQEAEASTEKATEVVTEDTTAASEGSGYYVVNGKNGKIHKNGECSATGTGEYAMTEPIYCSSYEEALEISKAIDAGLEKRNCGNCW